MLIKLFSFLLLMQTCLFAQAQDKTEYIIGLTAQGIRVATLEDVELGFNYQLESMTKDKNYQIKIKAFSSDEQLYTMLTQHKIYGYFGSPLLLVQNMKAFNLDSMYSPELNGEILNRYVLLVRKDSAINQLASLKSKTFSYCAVDEVGLMYLQKLLKDKNLGHNNTFFSKSVVKSNPNLAISALFFKQVQATVVLENDFMVASELNPQLKEQLVAIETSPQYLTNILAVSNHIEGPMSQTEYINNVVNIGGAIRNKRLLKSYNYGKLSKVKKEDLNSVRELIHSLYEDKGASN